MIHPSVNSDSPKAGLQDASSGAPSISTNEDSLSSIILSADKSAYAFQKWRELEERIDSQSIACSADWTEAWLQAYGDQVSYSFLLAESCGETQGICLITQSDLQKVGNFSVKTLHVGTSGEKESESACVEYNRLCVTEKYREQFLNEVFCYAQTVATWDQMHWDGYAISDLPSEEMQNKLSSLKRVVQRDEESRYFDFQCFKQGFSEEELEAEKYEIASKLGKSTRSNVRRRIRKLGEVQIEWANSLEEARSIFDELVERHQERWTSVGKPGAFHSKRFHQLQSSLIERLFEQQRVVLFRVKANTETVGCLYLLVDQNRLLDYVSGLASFEKFPSAGLITHYLCMEEACKRGYDAYDFLAGEKRHKQNLGKDSIQLHWVVYRRPRIKFYIQTAAHKTKSIFKKTLKISMKNILGIFRKKTDTSEGQS